MHRNVVPTGASDETQPHFRFTQPPSKVLHIRNLPWECTEDELQELCKPFGKILNTKLNVGTNHNQAFVEFADVNQAISMVSYYGASSEPASIRGKAVYLQYSTRQEITSMGKTGGGDSSSNVLLVTIEGVDSKDLSIEVLHVVFSAFGFVQKIATFEKAAGFQALVQYGDAETASSAKSALDGHSIPSYLLPEHVTSCSLRISFSAHNDLNVKFQSHRSRDYTNPYLPVASTATDGNPATAQKREHESNVLLASIDNMQYAVTIDVLHTVFSAYGYVQKIAIFEKTAGFQALIQYPDVATATAAKDALEGHCIYDGGYCKLRLSFSRHTDLNVKANNERSRDYTKPDLPAVAPVPSVTAAAASAPGLLGTPPVASNGAGVLPSPTQQVPPGSTVVVQAGTAPAAAYWGSLPAGATVTAGVPGVYSGQPGQPPTQVIIVQAPPPPQQQAQVQAQFQPQQLAQAQTQPQTQQLQQQQLQPQAQAQAGGPWGTQPLPGPPPRPGPGPQAPPPNGVMGGPGGPGDPQGPHPPGAPLLGGSAPVAPGGFPQGALMPGTPPVGPSGYGTLTPPNPYYSAPATGSQPGMFPPPGAVASPGAPLQQQMAPPQQGGGYYSPTHMHPGQMLPPPGPPPQYQQQSMRGPGAGPVSPGRGGFPHRGPPLGAGPQQQGRPQHPFNPPPPYMDRRGDPMGPYGGRPSRMGLPEGGPNDGPPGAPGSYNGYPPAAGPGQGGGGGYNHPAPPGYY